MAVQDVSGLALREVVHPELLDSVFKNNHFLGLFESKDVAGSTYDLQIKTTSNTGVSAVSEGGAVPAAQATSTSTAQVPFTDIFCTWGLTGAAIRAAGPNQSQMVSGQNDEATDAFEQLIDLANTTLMADSTTGILGLVDDDSTALYGLDRGVLTTLKSYVEAGGAGSLTENMLRSVKSTMRNAPYGGRPELIISSFTQRDSQYDSLLSAPVPTAGGGVGDAGFRGYTYAGIPWLGIPDFATDEVVFLSGISSNEIMILNHEPRGEKVQVGPSCTLNVYQDKLGKSDDSDTYLMNVSVALLVKKAWKNAKIENLST